MKKILVLILALILAAMPLISQANQKDDPLARYVNTGNGGKLNVRRSPHTHSDNLIAQLEHGTRVVIMEFYEGQTWAVIEFTLNGKTTTGYVQNRYLSVTKPAPVVKPTAMEVDNRRKVFAFRQINIHQRFFVIAILYVNKFFHFDTLSNSFIPRVFVQNAGFMPFLLPNYLGIRSRRTPQSYGIRQTLYPL